jgi:hypothetical protein
MFIHAMTIQQAYDIEIWKIVMKKLLCEDLESMKHSEEFNRTLSIALELFNIDNENTNLKSDQELKSIYQ